MRIVPEHWAHVILAEAASTPEGILPQDFATEGYSTPLPSVYTNLKGLTEAGLLRKDGRRYFVTGEGILVLDKLPILERLFKVVETERVRTANHN